MNLINQTNETDAEKAENKNNQNDTARRNKYGGGGGVRSVDLGTLVGRVYKFFRSLEKNDSLSCSFGRLSSSVVLFPDADCSSDK